MLEREEATECPLPPLARGRGELEGGRRERLRGGERGQGEVVRVRRGRGREGSREAAQAGLRARDGRRRGRRRGVGREQWRSYGLPLGSIDPDEILIILCKTTVHH